MKAGSFLFSGKWASKAPWTGQTYPAAWKLLDTYGLAEDECGHQMISLFLIHTPASYTSGYIYLTNSFTTSSFCNGHFCHQLQCPSWESTSGWSLSNSCCSWDVRSEGARCEQRGAGRARQTGTHFLQALCLFLLLVSALGSCNLISFPSPLFPFIFFRRYL